MATGEIGNYTNQADEDVWVVDDDSELASKIASHGIDWDPILDNDALIDIIPHLRPLIDSKQNYFRAYRSDRFAAFDIYKANVEYGIISETEEQHTEIINWYREMLSFPEQITEDNYETIVFPETPSAIQNYL